MSPEAKSLLTWSRAGGSRFLKCHSPFNSFYLSCCSAKKDMEKMGWGEVRMMASVPAELWLVPRMDPGCIVHVEHGHQTHMITLQT